MSYLLTVSYANEQVATRSYMQLVNTMKDDPCKVLLFDNQYPLNPAGYMEGLCKELGFKYYRGFANVGMYQAYATLLAQLPVDCKSAILYDGDHYPITPNWHLAILDVLKDESVLTCNVNNLINRRELHERGFTPVAINGHRCSISKEVITATMGGWNIPVLKSIGGITSPHKYYGGNEVDMWKHYKDHKFVVLDDYSEDKLAMDALHDWQYQEYKLLYAHRGLGISFEEYLKTDPQRHGYDNLIKQIFG